MTINGLQAARFAIIRKNTTNFAPGTQSPISLLEMGLHARSGKLIVLAPEGFWRKGNVDITARAYGVRQVQTMNELTAAVRQALTEAAEKGRFVR